ncbi:MAG: phosphoribosylformylglycinamidine cyclo-ligase [Thermaerobacterales bacterium]
MHADDAGSGSERDPLTYQAAGVDLAAADRLVERLKNLTAGAGRSEVLAGLGGFAGMFRLPAGLRRPVLLAAADGVGTKLQLARRLGRPDVAGRDLVAMNVNDLLVYGGEPWFFLDYVAVGKLDESEVADLVGGMAAACREAGCALLGGETAELPGMLRCDDLELAGFAVGGVEEDRLIDGRRVSPGDAVIGLAAAGLHSNGYSLVRSALGIKGEGWSDDEKLHRHDPVLGMTLGEALLQPTRLYVAPVLEACRHFDIRAMAHITGGGLPDNLPRTLPGGVRARLDSSAWPEPPIFDVVRRAGRVGEDEMRRAFNLGIGFTMVAAAGAAAALCAAIGPRVGGAWVIGEIEAAETGRSPAVIWR